MADVLTPNAQPTKSQNIPLRIPNSGTQIPLSKTVGNLRSGAPNLEVLSPVNQNGSFEFDRVIKSGSVLKRTKKTKNWKPIRVVLRPHAVSLYKDSEDTKLRHQIELSEITAVARQKDPKGKVQHVFGIFSPARNFHFSAGSDNEAQEWVELIRTHARIDEEEEEIVLMSPGGAHQDIFEGFERSRRELVSSSSEAEPTSFNRTKPLAVRSASQSNRQTSYTQNYSGNEQGSFSDFSDSGPAGNLDSNISLSAQNNVGEAQAVYGVARTSTNTRKVSQISNIGTRTDEERVMCHGWLYLLKSRGGVRQWKKVWVVLRPKCLAFYKDEGEYSATMIIPFHSIIDAVDIENVSKSKKHCMQILTEERNYRFCAPDEDALANWLGGLKSLLSRKKESQKGKATVETSHSTR